MIAGSVPLLAVHDAGGRRLVAIDKPIFTIGRGDACDLRLSGAEVSRDHAEIVLADDGYDLRDRESRYGTFVNGVRVGTHRLAHADQIALGAGGAVLIFLEAGAAAADEVAPVSLAGDFRHVAALLGALGRMGSDHLLDEVLALVVDAAIEATGAERGFILLAGADGALELTMGRGAGRMRLSEAEGAISRKIPEDVFATGRTVVVADLLDGEMAALHSGTVALGIRQVLCAPLRLVRYRGRGDVPPQPRNVGVLYMDSRVRGPLLSVGARVSLEALAGQAAIAIENARLYQEAIEKARIDEELTIASGIQQALLPERRRSGAYFDAVGSSVPSRTIGGDFFDYQDLGDRGFSVGLGDVSGKGPPAALLTALVQGVLATQLVLPMPPEELVALLNRILLARRLESRFLTVFLALLSPDGELTYCNAGQNAPILITAGGIQRLETGGTIVGVFPDARYERGRVRLAPGDLVVLFSDGLTEAEDEQGAEFGEGGVIETVTAAPHRSPDDVLGAVFEAVRAFTRGAPQRDDITALVLRYR